MTRDEAVVTARIAHDALTKLSRHAWNHRNSPSALLTDADAAAVDDAVEAIEAALSRPSLKEGSDT